MGLFLFLTCAGTSGHAEDPHAAHADSAADAHAQSMERHVTVTLDGQPTAGITVLQGGTDRRTLTDERGQSVVTLDAAVEGELWILAAHPEARTRGGPTTLDDDTPLVIELERFDASDNPAYLFEHPGSPSDRRTTNRCAHCHQTLNEAWHESPHRTSASNPRVQDVYAGTATALADEQACTEAGGSWWEGRVPGTEETGPRCYLGRGTLPDLDEACGSEAPCDLAPTATGACADCHAPALDGVLGGRDLLEATGLAYDFGVSCDVCHKVEAVDLASDAPGVAGRLRILRPSEDPGSPMLGSWQPLTFGPFDDVASVRMGGVQRDHFASGEICAGCHQHDQPVLVPGASADPDRWPEGTLPIHTTWEEWSTGPLGGVTPCQSCHMPPDPSVGNSADLGNLLDSIEPGMVAGWYRPPGTVRAHSWVGPRAPESGLLELAATLDLAGSIDGDVLTVEATVTNANSGHALPTGEPLRHLLLRVDASCDGTSLAPTGGDVLPAWAGALDSQGAGGDWLRWPGAEVGEEIVVMERPGDFHDYTGTGPFGDGRFDAADKGLPVEHLAGSARVVSVTGDAVTLDAVLPPGDRAYRLTAAAWPGEDGEAIGQAGRPGFAFARLLVDLDGAAMVPHHRAVDVASDNPLQPGRSWTSSHTFAATCASPTLGGVLLYRDAPLDLAAERRWSLTDRIVAEVTR